ncbi:MAG TPA: AMP-binding protein [Thermomicrobiales bacterium]|nr:AMP-binding protein [Thermomicrobiales bacterium]
MSANPLTDHDQFILRSPYPDVTYPDSALTPFILRNAAQLGDKPAIIDGPTGRVMTYSQLAENIRARAAGLAGAGLAKGDVLTIYAPNDPEYAVAFHAIISIGAIVSTANPLLTAGELGAQLIDANARYLLTVPGLLDAARSAAATAGIPDDRIFVFGEADGVRSLASLSIPGTRPPQVAIDPEDIAVLPYSSGTTGLPKGVMLTHRNLVAQDAQLASEGEVIQHDDVVIAVLPFFHIYGMSVIMNHGISQGATLVTMPRFDLPQFLQLIQDHRVTRAFLVPPIVLALAKHPIVENYDLSSLQVIFCGAAPLGADLSQAAASRLDCIIKQGYGLTETSPVTHLTPDAQVKDGKIGLLVASTEALIVDIETLLPLGRDQEGEVWVRGPQIMRGYLNRPEATAVTIVDGGWLRTGDIGSVDADGYFTIVDRLKELIKYKGYQVAPAELEAVLLSHPSVADAAVIGSPDEECGEVPKAFVVCKEEINATDLLEYVAAHVAPYKKIRLLDFVESVPKSASGKILRRMLIEQERERVRAAAGAASPV